ncbi:hypothetical protein Q9R19_11530 [Microbacterium sp. ARD32]|uniref:hypothetical protein n=1 Tax=Microbacterium sp. ARD32 TaxID=2962577 RepID=UPI0028829E45|nr:hypothetical protein [Microbacterium sp. ARD32]MDT0158258.1 hypothetical protein [Microbacterium sp. ARD32]
MTPEEKLNQRWLKMSDAERAAYRREQHEAELRRINRAVDAYLREHDARKQAAFEAAREREAWADDSNPEVNLEAILARGREFDRDEAPPLHGTLRRDPHREAKEMARIEARQAAQKASWAERADRNAAEHDAARLAREAQKTERLAAQEAKRGQMKQARRQAASVFAYALWYAESLKDPDTEATLGQLLSRQSDTF